MSHDSTIPSRLDPMQTVPAPLGVDARPRRASVADGGIARWSALLVAVVALFALARHFVH